MHYIWTTWCWCTFWFYSLWRYIWDRGDHQHQETCTVCGELIPILPCLILPCPHPHSPMSTFSYVQICHVHTLFSHVSFCHVHIPVLPCLILPCPHSHSPMSHSAIIPPFQVQWEWQENEGSWRAYNSLDNRNIEVYTHNLPCHENSCTYTPGACITLTLALFA